MNKDEVGINNIQYSVDDTIKFSTQDWSESSIDIVGGYFK